MDNGQLNGRGEDQGIQKVMSRHKDLHPTATMTRGDQSHIRQIAPSRVSGGTASEVQDTDTRSPPLQQMPKAIQATKIGVSRIV